MAVAATEGVSEVWRERAQIKKRVGLKNNTRMGWDGTGREGVPGELYAKKVILIEK